MNGRILPWILVRAIREQTRKKGEAMRENLWRRGLARAVAHGGWHLAVLRDAFVAAY